MASPKKKLYVDEPEGFAVKGEAGKAYGLKKALYGLKQIITTVQCMR